ncbi:protein crossbronx homolog [Diorhabda carinulata]|uniref:protein crossbronx homolog n=1 Tax=Diorhabda carinulata TaxID=1163345 RepID=UPI0025A27EFC|nr:protein crossbronx homolog [Diorhabda carinulata]
MHASFTKEDGNFQRQGSLRRVLPPEPLPDQLVSSKQNEDVQKLYKIYRQEYVILAEFKMVQNENIPGVYCIPSKNSPLVWFGVIFVHSGYYEEGIFRFTIFLDEEFPDSSHPKVIFHSKLFHPVIDNDSGELNLFKAFPKWSKSNQHIWQVVKYIQWIFLDMDKSVEHAVNLEAANMYKNDINKFREKAIEFVQESKKRLYDEPPIDDQHYITFEPYDPDIHDKVKATMLSQGEDCGSKIGLSWVLSGSKTVLTRPATPIETHGEL